MIEDRHALKDAHLYAAGASAMVLIFGVLLRDDTMIILSGAALALGVFCLLTPTRY